MKPALASNHCSVFLTYTLDFILLWYKESKGELHVSLR
jgi:hypothetical protein